MVCTTDNIYCYTSIGNDCKLHKIIRNGETVLVNTFTEIIMIVHSEVLQMFVQAIRDNADTYNVFLFPP